MACLPADHYMQNEERFRRSLMAAYEIAEKGHLVTLGIPPTHAATGYGYIHQGKSIGKFLEFEVFEVESFKEKPSFSQAEEFLASGGYAWNSGMFVWRTSSILEEIEMQMEELHAGLMEISGSFGKPDESVVLEKVWHRLKSQTIDYGIMEGARQVAMIAADGLGWFDIGGWDGLADARQKDDDGNLILAEEAIAIDSKGIVLFQDADGASKRLIAVLGVKDLIIVDTGDAILVCSKDRAEEVRRIVENLEVEGKIQYL
jgi:mannose-1-phosphate guanylyltransferase